MRHFWKLSLPLLTLCVSAHSDTILVASPGTSALTLTLSASSVLISEDVRGSAALAVNSAVVNALVVDNLTGTPPGAGNNALIGIGTTPGEALALFLNFSGEEFAATGVEVPVIPASLTPITDPALIGLGQAKSLGFLLVDFKIDASTGDTTYLYTLASVPGFARARQFRVGRDGWGLDSVCQAAGGPTNRVN